MGMTEAVIRSTATDATGVTKIELWVDDALYTSEISPVAQGQSPFSVSQEWTPQALGAHRIVVKAYNASGNMQESATMTLIVVSEPPEPPPTQTPATPPPSPTSTLPPPPTDTPVPPIVVTPGLYTVVNVASDDVLNVREQPGVVHPIVGTIPPYGMDVEVTGVGEEVDGAVWVLIRYQDITGWVNSNYLARPVGSVDEEIAARAVQIIMAVKHEDLETLASLVHPDKGVRFSPYTHVRAEPGAPEGEDLVFSADHIRDFFADQMIYTWGRFDGTGEPIAFTFRQYHDRFIYDADFARPHVVGFNETVGVGNRINNIARCIHRRSP
jgi:hypothetical protein